MSSSEFLLMEMGAMSLKRMKEEILSQNMLSEQNATRHCRLLLHEY